MKQEKKNIGDHKKGCTCEYCRFLTDMEKNIDTYLERLKKYEDN